MRGGGRRGVEGGVIVVKGKGERREIHAFPTRRSYDNECEGLTGDRTSWWMNFTLKQAQHNQAGSLIGYGKARHLAP